MYDVVRGIAIADYMFRHPLSNAGHVAPSKTLDSSLKRHTAFIKRLRQSLAGENYDQLMKDISSLSLEKHVDELPGAAVEGISRCKSERDVWSAVEVRLSS